MHTGAVPIVQDLVLLGAGHAHVAVLKSFGMRPLPGVRLTLVSLASVTPYSGMLPGLIAGHYNYDDVHVELRPLARYAGADFCVANATGLDLNERRVLLADRPPIRFDVISIDTGSIPRLEDVSGAAQHVVPVKPIHTFLPRWEQVRAAALTSQARPFRILVVGGGAGGVELALCARYRLDRDLKTAGRDPESVEIHLLTQTPELLPTHNPSVRRRFQRLASERRVRVHAGCRAVEVRAGCVRGDNGKEFEAEAILWVTQAAAPDWLRESGLAVDGNGFVAVTECLQSTSHACVFAAGDVAAVGPHPRPKAGVFAVRQGMPLAENLRRALHGEAPRPFVPQRQFLSLISTGDAYAVASRGWWSAEGSWVWRWKERIDRRWMRMYQDLPTMRGAPPQPPQDASSAIRDAAATHQHAPAVRCGGCAAKIGQPVLERALAGLSPFRRADVLVGLDAPDDAAVSDIPAGFAVVHTVDHFRPFLNDPWLFGRVTAQHALTDIFAMGAQPQSALAIVTVPFGADKVVGDQLSQVLAGANATLVAHETTLAGGHSAEGPELAFGLAVQGWVRREELLRKSGLRPGDALVLTKPLGTGILFAADMRGRARGRWIDAALVSMLRPTAPVARCLRRFGAISCTDVTGFGLAGHLLEMLRASSCSASIDVRSIPVLPGVEELLAEGIRSTLQPQNERATLEIAEGRLRSEWTLYPVLFDPQTAGGLLAGIAPERADACVTELREAGFAEATVIGRVSAWQEGESRLQID